jgi:acyl-CoA dehydrogenase
VEKEVVPHYPEWEKGGRMPREVFEQMGSLGMLGVAIPEEYGGGGQPDYRYNVVMQEEAARALVTLSTVRTQLEVILPYFLHYANAEQRERWFPACRGHAAHGDRDDRAGDRIGPGGHAHHRGARRRRLHRQRVKDLHHRRHAGRPGDRGRPHGHRSGQPAQGADAVRRRGRHGGLHRGPRAGEDGLQGAGHRRAVVRRRARARANVLGRRARRSATSATTCRRSGSPSPSGRCRRPVGDRRGHRLHQEPQGVRHPVASFQNTKFELAACSTEVEAAQAMLDRAVALHVDGELSAADARG